MSNRKIKYCINFILIISFFLQMVLQGFDNKVFAETVSGTLTIQQSIKDHKTIVSPNEEVTVQLDYRTISTTTDFKNVEIEYTLPIGAKFVSVTKSGHVINSDELNALTADSRTVVFKLANSLFTDVLDAGATGNVEVTFKFPSPSVYPNGKVIQLNEAVINGQLKINSNNVSGSSNASLSLTYNLNSSWKIIKEGPAEASISNDPTKDTLNVSYTIKLIDGNIDLKDVEITDTLPPNAAFVSSTPEPSSNSSGTVIWNLADVSAETGASIGVTLSFPIKRNSGDIGIENNDTRTNKVTVSGYPVDLNSSGTVIKAGDPITFSQNTASITTTFKQSTKKWGVKTTGPTSEIITKDLSVDKMQVTYTLGMGNGDIDLKNVDMIYTVPNDAEYVSSSGGTYNSGNHTIKWHYSDVAAISPPSESVTLSYKIDRENSDGDLTVGLSNTSTRTNIVRAIGYPIEVDTEGKIVASTMPVVLDPSAASITTIFVDSDEKWYVEKSGPSSITILNDDSNYTGDVEYTVSLKSTGTGTYNVPISELTVEDTLPPFAEYIPSSSNSNITWDSFKNEVGKLTWVFKNINPSNPPTITYKVKYPIDRNEDSSDKGIKPEVKLKNSVSVEGYPVDKNGNKSSQKLIFRSDTDVDTYVFTTDAVSQPPPKPSISIEIQDYNKTTKDKNFDVGDEVLYLIDFNNEDSNGNTLYNTALVDENLPAEIDYSQIRIPKSSDSVPYTFKYKTNKAADWKNGESYNTNSQQTIEISSLGLGSGEYITGIRIEYASIPKDFAFEKPIELQGKINSKASDEELIQNIAKLEYQYKEFNGFSTLKALQDDVSFHMLLDGAYISLLQKNKLTKSAEYAHMIGETLTFELKFKNDERLGTAAFKNPIMVDVVPKGFEFVESSYVLDSGIPSPTFEKFEDYPAEGQTTLKWSWDRYDVDPGKTVTLKYNLKILNYAGVGEHYNKFYLMSKGKYKVGTGIFTGNDTSNLDKDPDTKEYIKANDCKIVVDETPALNAYKWVQGELDKYEKKGYSTYPDKGNTTPGGAADYKLQILNSGNVYIKKIEVIDILPYEGDTAVLDPSASRGSTWTPYLIKTLDHGIQNVVVDAKGISSNANVTVYYSTATDPTRSDGKKTIGTQSPNWSIEPPNDITSVRSLKFEISDFKDSKGLEPGSEINLNWYMRSPVGAPIGEDQIAWNSISMAGTASRETGEQSLLPAEPKMVGIEVKSNPYGEIGDFIWFDHNGNGIQDDGYDDQSAGINGITVHLYHDDGTGTFNCVDTTLTGNDHNGNPGYYLFSALEPGKYYVTFEIPVCYSITSKDSGPDDAKDSDGDWISSSETENVRTAEIVITDANKLVHNVDLGLTPTTTGTPGIEITKKAVGYKKTDGTVVSFLPGTKAPVNKGETVLYAITVKNTGTIPLNNIKLEDEMTNAGFKFTTVKFNDAKEAVPVSEDPNIRLIQDRDNSLIIDTLKPNEQYELESEYKVLQEDVTVDPLKNTLKVWANELKDKTDPGNAAATVEESVYISALRLEKTITEIKKVGQSSFTAYDPSNHSIEVGDTVKYSIKAYNDGSSTLNNVLISDPKLGITSYPIGFINSGTSVELKGDTTEYTVQDADRSVLTNTATATADDIRYEVKATDTSPVSDLTITKTVSAINAKTPVKYKDNFVAKVGDVITYKVTLKNTGSAVLDNITVVEDKVTTSGGEKTLINNQSFGSDMHPPDSVTTSYTYTVGFGDIDSSGNTIAIDNHVWVKSKQTRQKESSVKVEIADLEITKSANPGPYKVGDPINYTVTVKNIGSIPLDDITVNDPMLSIIPSSKISLAKGASQTLTETYKVQESDLLQGSDTNPNDAKINNTATATHPAGSKTSTVTVDTKGLKLTKTGVKQEPGKILSVGDKINYTIDVKNTGSSNLTDVLIKDLKLGISQPTIINAGQTYTITKAYTVQSGDLLGDIINTATATSGDLTSSDSNTIKVIESYPSIDIQKTSYIGAYESGKVGVETSYGKHDDPITYLFEITNTVDKYTYLKNFKINDEDLKINKIDMHLISGNDPLAPGEKLRYYYQTVVKGDLRNKVSVEATPCESDGTAFEALHGDVVSDSDTADVVEINPEIKLEKTILTGVDDHTVSDSVYRIAGDKITYVFKVTNTSDDNTYLNGIVITDGKLGINPSNQSNLNLVSGKLPLEPGKTAEYRYTTTVTSSLINTASVTANPVDASGTDYPLIDNVSDTDTAEVTVVHPSLVLEKTAAKGSTDDITKSSEEVKAYNGEAVTYFFKIRNTGDTYLDHLSFRDNDVKNPSGNPINEGDLTLVSGTLPIAPNGEVIYKYETTVSGNLLNTATAEMRPTHSNGNLLEGFLSSKNPKDSDTAQVKALAKLSGTVWLNANNDSLIDPEEKGIQGVKLNLYLSTEESTSIKEIQTDSNGQYSFSGLSSGTYIVKVDDTTLPPGISENYELDSSKDGVVRNIQVKTDGINIDNINFGYNHTGTIGDNVWYDLNENGIQDSGENGVPNVVLRLIDTSSNVQIGQNITTGPDGSYIFEYLPAGEYKVEIVSTPVGIEQVYSPYNKVYPSHKINLNPGQSITNVDFGYNYSSSIGDTVWYDLNENAKQDADEKGIDNVRVNLYAAPSDSTVVQYVYTDHKGQYAFKDLDAGTYIVKVDSSTLPLGVKQVFDPDSTLDHKNTVVLAKNEQKNDIDFGYNHTGSIGDYIWFDMDHDNIQEDVNEEGISENGVSGARLELKDTSGNVLQTTATNSDGSYHFNKLAAGTYVVEVDQTTLPKGYKAGYDLDGGFDSSAEFTLNAGETRKDLDFGFYPIPYLSIQKEADRSTAQVGDVVYYKITLTNEGKGLLHNVIVQDDMLNLHKNIGNLTTGQSVYEKLSYKITQFDVDHAVDDKIINTAKAWSDETAEITDSSILYLNTNPRLKVLKIVSKTPAKRGETVKYTISATNTGDVTLHNLRLKDDLLNVDNLSLGDLAVGQSVYKTMEYTIKMDDPNPLYNTAQVSSTETGPVNSNQCELKISNPILEVAKTAPSTANIGETISYTIKVSNKGNRVIKNVSVEDNLLGFSEVLNSLDVNESRSWIRNYTVDESDWPGVIINTVTAHGTVAETVYSTVYDSPTTNKTVYFNVSSQSSVSTVITAHPVLEIEKSANAAKAKVNDEITYTIVIKNQGDVTLTNVHVQDSMFGLNDSISSLGVHESKTYHLVYKVTQADEDAGVVINTAQADSDQTDLVEDTVRIVVEKTTNPGGGSGAGGSGGGSPGGGGSTEDIFPEDKPDTTLPTEEQQKNPEKSPVQDEQQQKELVNPQVPQEQKEQSTQKNTTLEDTPIDGKIEISQNGNVVVQKAPTHGTVTFDENGNWHYIPEKGFKGKDQFVIKIIHLDGSEEEIVIQIDVEEVPSGTPNLPKTGERSNLWFYLIGCILISIGGILKRKRV